METLEWIKMGLMILLGITASYKDIKTGLIPNRILILFVSVGACLDIFYFVAVARDTALLSIGNIISAVLTSAFLYGIHAFAGGDLKLVAVLSLLYPSGAYLTYGSSDITLFLAVIFAIFWGYVYLIASTLVDIRKGNVTIGSTYVRAYLLFYLKTYFTAMSHIAFLALLSSAVTRYVIQVPAGIAAIGGITVTWLCSRYTMPGNRYLLSAVIGADIMLALLMRVSPLPIAPRAYMLTAVLLFCQMTIRTNLYRTIPTANVQKGMILSMASTMPMQASRIKGMPGISSEDLQSRLTTEQAESVRRWGESPKGLDHIVIVRKIPFAIFITFGFLTYFIIWGALV